MITIIPLLILLVSSMVDTSNPHASSAFFSSSENEGIRLGLNVFKVFLVSKKKFFSNPLPPHTQKKETKIELFICVSVCHSG